jgi:mRNA-degrading endonuclease YafQ of YafQ-DinJ toxin-antitoxin module
MKIGFATQFRRDFKKLPTVLQEEVLEKIELFKDIKNHQTLKVHTLHGKMNRACSFSINYRYRVVFVWQIKNKFAILHNVGDHSIYK